MTKAINTVEKKILSVVAKSPGISAIKLRAKTNLPVVSFIDAINSLVEARILYREGAFIYFSSYNTSQIGDENITQFVSNYISTISTPQLSPEEFYLPARDKFFIQRNLNLVK